VGENPNLNISEFERSSVEKHAQGVANFLKNEKTTSPMAVVEHFATLSEKTISNERNQSTVYKKKKNKKKIIFFFSLPISGN
jgi:hypothetical protein